MYKIAVFKGDGVGPEVIREAIKVLNTISEIYGIDFEFLDYPYGAEHYLKTGETLPDYVLDELKECDAILFSAVGDPRVKPGILEQEILLKLRFHFDLYVNLRPIITFEGVKTPINKRVRIYYIRENTEDFYVAAGDHVSKTKYTSKLNIKRNLYNIKMNIDIESDEEFAYQIGVISKKGAERVIRFAFEFAKEKGLSKVTSVDKANVLSYIYNFWRDIFKDVASKFPEISYEFVYVDAMAMYLITKPESFEVIVSPNMFGDILTDLGAAIQGGIGLAPSANINPEKKFGMFEPIHGSAPDIAGKNISNPIAMILSTALMLDFLGEKDASKIVEKSVSEILKEGKYLTPDLGGNAKTYQVGDAICKKLKEISKQF